jgi:hypothetical protein
MLNFLKENDAYILTIGKDFVTNLPKRIIPVNKEEAIEIAEKFNEDFAVSIGKGEFEWIFNSFKLTDAPNHPYGWTDTRKRSIFHFKDQKWHMTPGEIMEIGRMAKLALESN